MTHLDPNRLPPGIPPDAVPFLQEMGYLEADPLAVGGPAPAAPVLTLEGECRSLAELWRRQPAVLIFGSYT